MTSSRRSHVRAKPTSGRNEGVKDGCYYCGRFVKVVNDRAEAYSAVHGELGKEVDD